MRWSQVTEAAPGIAAAATEMLYGHGLGLGFLATVRADGGPRVRPICPVLAGDLYKVERVLVTLTLPRPPLPAGHTVWVSGG